jgi:outer membrane receptor for monomeric catechols
VGKPGGLPKRNALSEIGENWGSLDKNVLLFCSLQRDKSSDTKVNSSDTQKVTAVTQKIRAVIQKIRAVTHKR